MKTLLTILASIVVSHVSAQIATPDFIVAQDGSGNFPTVQAAIDAAPDYPKEGPTVIFVKNGVYRERVTVPPNKSMITLVGESAAGTIITGDVYASQIGSTGRIVGTAGTATVYIHAEDFTAANITFENSAVHPQGKGDVGQAVAVTVTGDRVRFTGCRFLGNQDTLYTMGFGNILFSECYIEGTTDFIFGASTAFFDDCVIHSKRDSYITAASTPEGRPWGYVFRNCRLTAAPGITRVYLGRPWRPFAKTAFVECELGSHIRPEGWHNWSKPDAERTTFYAEGGNRGAGAATDSRVKWSHKLSAEQIAELTPEKVLGMWAK
jgi:pectinesterase